MYLLFFIYLSLLCWFVTKIQFIRKTGLPAKVVVLLFLVKVVAGVILGYFAKGVTNDYWPLNTEGINEQRLLLSNPWAYFTNIFQSGYAKGYGGFFDALPSYWNDLRMTLISKGLAWFNFLSNGNYYINSLLFNFFCFMGHVAFYKTFIQVYPQQKNNILICSFLLPSTLYFSSGMHKDGIVFTALGFLCYAVFQSIAKNKFNAKRITVQLLALAVLFFIRSYVLLLVIPALLLWVITVKYKLPVFTTFVTGYIIAGVLFFGLHYVTGSFNPLEAVTKKQEAFFMLEKATTQVSLDTLKPNFKSFAGNAPEALNHLLLRPYLWELPVRSLLLLNIELLFYQFLFLAFIFFRMRKSNSSNTAFIYFAVFFTLTIFLLTGYIVPNLGSIVRYRSIYLPLIITPLLCSIDWGKLKKTFKIKN